MIRDQGGFRRTGRAKRVALVLVAAALLAALPPLDLSAVAAVTLPIRSLEAGAFVPVSALDLRGAASGADPAATRQGIGVVLLLLLAIAPVTAGLWAQAFRRC